MQINGTTHPCLHYLYVDTKRYRAKKTGLITAASVVMAVIALLALSSGAGIYLFDRTALAYFVPAGWPWIQQPSRLGFFSGIYPAFAHTFAFVLLTAAVARRSVQPTSIAIAWFLLNALFETGQHPALAPNLAATIPNWFRDVPILSLGANYFLQGTFDAWDIAANAAGAIAGVFTIGLLRHWQSPSIRRATSTFSPARILAVNVVALVGLICTLGSASTEGDNGGTTGPELSISISSTDTVVSGDAKDLRGYTECDGCPPTEVGLGYCPAIQCPTTSTISITWRNRSTGAAGIAYHGYTRSCSCLFSYCFSSCSHVWQTTVPLTLGENPFDIDARNTAGASGRASITITRVPSAPTGVTASAGDEQITLSWNPVTDATSYNLYWSMSRDVTKDTGTKIAGVTSPYIHTGLPNDATHYYLITAVNGAYESDASDVVWSTTGWRTESLHSTTSTTEATTTSIAMDSAGAVHLHYSYDEHIGYAVIQYNYYVTNKTGVWGGATLLDNPMSVDAAIALDSGNNVHISYSDFPGITHGVYGAGTWTFDVLDANGACSSDIAIDAANHVHVAYYANGGQLRYINNVSGSWSTPVVVDTLSNLGCPSSGALSLAVSATGVAYVIYHGTYPDYGLKYATNESGSWSVAMVDSSAVMRSSAALDANGKIHAAFADNSGNLKYASNASGTWLVDSIENTGSPNHPSLALDAAGKARVSYINRGYYELRYASNVAGTWRIAIIDQVDRDMPTAVALDTHGKAHISYTSNTSIKYATNK